MSRFPNTAIVLLTYNSIDFVKEFLPKIIAYSPLSEDVVLYVIDNASTDETSNYVSRCHPEANIINIPVNQGFTGGYLFGLKQIEATNYVLISSDIEVTPGWLEPAMNLLNSSDKIACVQPKVMSYHNRNEFEYAGAGGGYIDALGYPFCRGRMFNMLETDAEQYNDQTEIFWASGACLFIKSEAWHQANGFDSDFFAHMEEIDLCWRLKGMGYKIMYAPESVIYHVGGSVIKYGSPTKIFRNHRNNILMLIKNLPLKDLLWKVPVRIVLDYLAALHMITEKNPNGALQVPKAHFDILWNLRFWWKKRALTQKSKENINNSGIYPGSIIWDFFVVKKRLFSDLKWKVK